MKKRQYLFSALLSLSIFFFGQSLGSAELVSYKVSDSKTNSAEEKGGFFDGMVVFDDQSFYIHLNKDTKVEQVRVESFLVFSVDGMDSFPVLYNDKLRGKDLFAVKLVQEFNLETQEYRIIRGVFYDGGGVIIEEISYDDALWQSLLSKEVRPGKQYFDKMYEVVEKSLKKNNLDIFLRY